MRGILNRPDIGNFVFYIFLLIPIFILSYEGELGDGFYLAPTTLFIWITAMLCLSVVEIPVYKFKTKKPDYSPEEQKLLEEIYAVPVAEELREGTAAYMSSVTLNVGGSILPIILSFYLLAVGPMIEILVILLIMVVITYVFSTIRDGIGVVVPSYIGLLVVPLAFVLVEDAAPVIFITGVCGILLGIITKLLSMEEENGSAYFNIGGSGNFNAIFITIILSVLLSIV
ncbi:MAG: DUF1614 domain-containing protein [Halobacteriota archaeon]|nr:DUF1614 domain-containing protein [Halobacteriota archaeon]